MERMNHSKWIKMGLITILTMLLLTTTVFAAEIVPLGETEKAWWSDATTARWKKVDKAKSYQVRLFEDGEDSVVRLTVETTSVDFSSYMKDGRNYYFEVRAITTKSQRNQFLDGEWVQSDEQTAENIGDVSGRWRSYQQGKKYNTAEGKFISNQWYLISGNWYWFSNDAYMMTGWQNINEKWYYLGSDGVMQTGWKQIDESWYHLKSDGSMSVGWCEFKPGQWYYLNVDGKMVVNAVVDGYQLDAAGLRK